MPLSFCFVGLLNIFFLFWCDMRNAKNIMYFLALVCLQIGYFVPPVEMPNFSLNILNLIGLLLALIGAVMGTKHNHIFACTVVALVVSVIYLCVNSVSNDYLIFLRPIYLFLVVGVLTVFFKNFSSKILFSVLCIVLCEFGTLALIKGNFAFYPLFCPDILDCLIPLVYLIIFECLLQNVIYKKPHSKKEKQSY